MKRNTTKDKKNVLVENQLRKIWESLESHLHFTHANSQDGRAWHVSCVKDYAEQLTEAVKLFEHGK